MGILSVISFLLCLATPLILVLLIVIAIVKKNSSKGEKSASFGVVINSIYVYLCLCIFLCLSIVSAISLINTSLDYFLPEESIDTQLESEMYIKNKKNRNCVDMITSVGTLAISLPMFAYHIKLSKEEK